MSRPKIYLGGSMAGLSYSAALCWRRHLTGEVIDFADCLDPMRGKEYLKNDRTISDKPYGTLMSTARAITTRDRNDVLKRADAVVFNFRGCNIVSIGSMIELGWADSKRIPIIVIMEENNIHQHLMLQECANWIVEIESEAVDILKKLYKI